MKRHKNNDLEEYIYIRLTKSIKQRIKIRAKTEGSNMTIWARQVLMRELDANNEGA